MNIVKFCLLPAVLLVLLAVGVGVYFVSGLPTEWTVERERTIEAPPAEIHPHVADLRRWPEWGVWYVRDDSMEIEYFGEPGAGQRSEWTGKDGDGTNEILSADPAQGVTTRTTFAEFPPIETRISYEPDESGGTLVRWRTVGGGDEMIDKLFGYVSDEMMGPDFAGNLARLEELVETGSVSPVTGMAEPPE